MEKKQRPEEYIANLPYLEQLYNEYKQSPNSVDSSWKELFKHIEANHSLNPKSKESTQIINASPDEKIERLANAYRRYGHILASINPLNETEQNQEVPQLKLEENGLRSNESKVKFPSCGLLPETEASLESIINVLKAHYCQTIGFEFDHVSNLDAKKWIQEQIESGRFEKPLEKKQQVLILEGLTNAELLESFLHTKHVGKKRFSLEGAETLIPMLSFLITQAAQDNAKEIFIGMSHRGRLNVLANILNKSIEAILKDFDEDYEPMPSERMGDIRYHKGHANKEAQTLEGKTIKLTMAPNPSHLESVDAVVEGQAKGRQVFLEEDQAENHVIPLLLHGDAAVAGQGIVYETLQMSKLKGYGTGGTIHFVINNQIGFTTSPQAGRSTPYCTDIALAFGMPVFHVNAEDPEACVRTALFALEIRKKFNCDVFVDLYCYRKYGHNEGDEPAFTQPVDYKIIRQKKSIRQLYLEGLIKNNFLNEENGIEIEEKVKANLQMAYTQAEKNIAKESSSLGEDEESSIEVATVETGVEVNLLKTIAEKFSIIPSHLQLHPKLEHLIKEREKSVKENKQIDWGLAEFLAYGTLLWEGIPVRLSGQDCGRGTFSHRHALWVDKKTNEEYYPLSHLSEKQGRFDVLNSCLSEAGVLGFEYGYSTIIAKGLTIWEAQFGDFVNSAQVIVDQYIASGEEKWGQTSDVVLFLPHGFEGQGPEHSSARLERFLTLCGHDNMRIVNPTTPAQLFHLLRRQIKLAQAKPLIVFTPKGLLRHAACTSSLEEFSKGSFLPILDDPIDSKQVNRLILCSGRIYYDLDAVRKKENRADLAFIRIEQLYPLDEARIKKIFERYKSIKECFWVQEEPENMGGWNYILPHLQRLVPSNVQLSFVGRPASATPATGFLARHKQEHTKILHRVFGK